MRVISKKRLREFWLFHPQAESALKKWHKEASAARWNDLIEARKTFPSADPVKVKGRRPATVFNVGKTGCRIIAEINYPFGRVYIRFVLAHDEYAKGSWKSKL